MHGIFRQNRQNRFCMFLPSLYAWSSVGSVGSVVSAYTPPMRVPYAWARVYTRKHALAGAYA